MNVILKENVENLGTIGDVVKVTGGYARNYLLPRGLVAIASDKAVEQVEHHKRALRNKLAKLKEEKDEYRKELEAVSLVIRRKSGENNKLFGSITSQDIWEALEQKGLKVERKSIDLDAPIKKLGSVKVPVRLMEGVVAQINVSVVADAE
jgi:large subunit ribosomal protein L9